MKFDHASESFKRRNPHLFGGMGSGKSQQDVAPTLDCCNKSNQSSEKSMGKPPRVSITSFRKRLLDHDNFVGGCKPLRDSIAASLELDDSEKFIAWEYHQIKSNGKQHTIVKIDL